MNQKDRLLNIWQVCIWFDTNVEAKSLGARGWHWQLMEGLFCLLLVASFLDHRELQIQMMEILNVARSEIEASLFVGTEKTWSHIDMRN